ncbi:FabD/lysophospholipase-like protein [Patellaria atrata CBS 101060]|uniref:FabD/lysophospholipase-like protein n=1 Tax=Patellaria atrata CBS 101060 TaxID=1346257 RepID=A0A9P4S363_9PEZI|nr:FabD/lysophospholipase-like protein [Patellaria atrata CBS 101060]
MDSNTRLGRKDTTKGPPLRILSLDGGGVRGYSMLIILQELMHRTFVEQEGRAPKRHEIPKPCEHFDLIAGTGTGGLIAIMLGRLRMDIDTCKDVYVRMTKKVFETDKTIAGIPYRSTLFKASKLEEAIKECVREHTLSDNEGNDTGSTMNLNARMGRGGSQLGRVERAGSNASRYSQIGNPAVNLRYAGMRWGDPNALLYDTRENRTKTAVTAVYKGTPKNGSSVLLRSYDSRKEPAPEFHCTIWQAGRATSATGLAFKPIQIGQSVFIDEGAGKYNPGPQILDEAVCNEWPGREVSVFVSIGTGKRPAGSNHRQHEWWEGFVGGGMGDFAEARRRLINKIEGCEDTHQYMLKEHLSKRQVNPENYYRFNVEVGVGEFGMNEWARLAEISTNTRQYLQQASTQNMSMSSSAKIGRIARQKIRYERQLYNQQQQGSPYANNKPLPGIYSPAPNVAELPAEDVIPATPASPATLRPVSQLLSPGYARHHSLETSNDKYAIVSSDEYPQVVDAENSPRYSADGAPPRRSAELYGSNPHSSNGSLVPSPNEPPPPPPRPPKTPIQGQPKPPSTHATLSRPPAGVVLPYPDSDGPPPVVNMARKPELGR